MWYELKKRLVVSLSKVVVSNKRKTYTHHFREHRSFSEQHLLKELGSSFVLSFKIVIPVKLHLV